MKVAVRAVAAWSSGLETNADWERWAHNPTPLAGDELPKLPDVPPMLRRRCSALTKAMLAAAFRAAPPACRGSARTVFSSRHGAIHLAVRVIDTIYANRPVSPLQFSHSVHNAAAGQFSQITGNRAASSSIAGGSASFGAAFLEALLFLERDPQTPVLLVHGDEPVPPLFLPLVDEPEARYAVALLLGGEGASPVEFELAPISAAGGEAHKWPEAIEFVRWWHAGSGPLTLGSAPQGFRFRRVARR